MILLIIAILIALFYPQVLRADIIDTMAVNTWVEIPNTKMRAVAWSGGGVAGEVSCTMACWASGAIDTTRNRLIVGPGGGHNGYSGNEIYAFSLTTLTWARITSPELNLATADGGDPCPAVINSSPCATHTYNDIQYSPASDRYLIVPGWNNWTGTWATPPVWSFNPTSNTWAQGAFAPQNAGRTGSFSVFDSTNNLVWTKWTTGGGTLASYNPATNTWSNKGSGLNYFNYTLTAAYDPVRKKMIAIGSHSAGCGGCDNHDLYMWDLTNPAATTINETTPATTGNKACETAAMNGLDYDPISDSIICTIGGQQLYKLDLATMIWTTLNPTGGTPGSVDPTKNGSGIFGRFRYVPGRNVFIYANSVDENIFVYKAGTGSGGDTTSPSTPTGLVVTPTSSTQINLSWTASTDNVAVTGYNVERCSGTGCTTFAEVYTPTATTQSDTGRTPSTLYRYRVRAHDAANNLSSYSSIQEATTAASGGGSDFSTRCAAAGVIRCFGFDTVTDLGGTYGDNYGYFPNDNTNHATCGTNNNNACPVIDTSVAASGGGSMRFDQLTNSGSGGAGQWFTNFSTDLSIQFGASTQFWIQYRERFSPEIINTNYTSSNGFKQSIIVTGDKSGCSTSNTTNCWTSCVETTIVTENSEQKKMPRAYHSCVGGTAGWPTPYSHLERNFTNDNLGGAGDISLQDRPSPYCSYLRTFGGGGATAGTQFPPTGNCVPYVAGEWMTFTYRVTIGPRGANGVIGAAPNNEFLNSNITMWVARDGQTSEKIYDFNLPLVAGSVAQDQKYGKIWLLPYQTNKSSAQAHATASVWYDELIISTQQIADPGGAPVTGPASPVNIRVSQGG